MLIIAQLCLLNSIIRQNQPSCVRESFTRKFFKSGKRWEALVSWCYIAYYTHYTARHCMQKKKKQKRKECKTNKVHINIYIVHCRTQPIVCWSLNLFTLRWGNGVIQGEWRIGFSRVNYIITMYICYLDENECDDDAHQTILTLARKQDSKRVCNIIHNFVSYIVISRRSHLFPSYIYKQLFV